MREDVIYSDKLVEMTNESILFRAYYFPFGQKRIPWSEIESFEVKQPTLLNGKYRLHGSGDFKTWFARDLKRPSRNVIFILHLYHQQRRIGFTVESSEKALHLLKTKLAIKNV